MKRRLEFTIDCEGVPVTIGLDAEGERLPDKVVEMFRDGDADLATGVFLEWKVLHSRPAFDVPDETKASA